MKSSTENSERNETIEKLDSLQKISVEKVIQPSVTNYQLPEIKLSSKKNDKEDPMLFKELTNEEKIDYKKE